MPGITRYSSDVRERAVRMVHEQAHDHPSRWAAISVVAERFGCSREAVRRWVHESDRQASRAGSTSDRTRLIELERENRQLRRTNALLRKASAMFAAELDRRKK